MRLLPTTIKKLPIDGNINFGSYRELLGMLTVASNTIRTPFVTLGTENKDISNTITPYVMWTLANNLTILLDKCILTEESLSRIWGLINISVS